jgi:acyl-CoA reductase-like NAD-dependent aldehyde dehydrogenase
MWTTWRYSQNVSLSFVLLLLVGTLVAWGEYLLLKTAAGPAGGIKGSGWGSNNGHYGIEQFLYNKALSLVPTSTNMANGGTH